MAGEQRAAIPESADEELTPLRRLAVVEQLLATLVGVLDLREVFTRVSEVAGQSAQARRHCPSRHHRGPAARDPVHNGGAGGGCVSAPASNSGVGTVSAERSWEFEIIDDLQSEPDRERHSASLGYRSILRVPVRLKNEVIALLVIQSRTPAAYRPADDGGPSHR